MSVISHLSPLDSYNQTLREHGHPQHWKNPKPQGTYNIVVMGAGTAGLITAIGAVGLGAKVALIEEQLMGGDCLNVGCVPSKALIASARRAEDVAQAGCLGIRVSSSSVDFPAVMTRLRALRSQLSVIDSAQRYQTLGVDVFLGHGQFTGPREVEVGGQRLRFKKAVLATGTRPKVPTISGLEEEDILTNETIFNLTQLPARLAVIGAGPIGCELGQAFLRLGSKVTLLHRHDRLLEHEDHESAQLLEQRFREEGMTMEFNAEIIKAEKKGAEKIVTFKSQNQEKNLTVDAILAGVGRQPTVTGLGLEKAGVDYDLRRGIVVNDFLQTSNRAIFAAGDCCLPHKLTHAAEASAKLVIQNSLFGGKKRFSRLTIPRAVYTAPELAQVGLTLQEATQQGKGIETFKRDLKEVDRARLDGQAQGFIKIHVKKGTDRMVGATIVASHAGDMISEVSVAMAANLGLGRLYEVIHPYPTQADALKQVAGLYKRTQLTPLIKKLFQYWLHWKRA